MLIQVNAIQDFLNPAIVVSEFAGTVELELLATEVLPGSGSGTVVLESPPKATLVELPSRVALRCRSDDSPLPHADNPAIKTTHNKSFFMALVCRKPSLDVARGLRLIKIWVCFGNLQRHPNKEELKWQACP